MHVLNKYPLFLPTLNLVLCFTLSPDYASKMFVFWVCSGIAWFVIRLFEPQELPGGWYSLICDLVVLVALIIDAAAFWALLTT